MGQSLVKNLIHLTFSTKNRAAMISDSIRVPLHKYITGILKQCDSPRIEINSVEDHVHVLFSLSKNWALKDVVEELKKGSSKWIKMEGGKAFASFYWQAGYGAFSVSQSAVPRVAQYNQTQAEHHKRRSFQDEFRVLCRRHGVEIDERYVWD